MLPALIRMPSASTRAEQWRGRVGFTDTVHDAGNDNGDQSQKAARNWQGAGLGAGLCEMHSVRRRRHQKDDQKVQHHSRMALATLGKTRHMYLAACVWAGAPGATFLFPHGIAETHAGVTATDIQRSVHGALAPVALETVFAAASAARMPDLVALFTGADTVPRPLPARDPQRRVHRHEPYGISHVALLPMADSRLAARTLAPRFPCPQRRAQPPVTLGTGDAHTPPPGRHGTACVDGARLPLPLGDLSSSFS